MSPYRGRLAPSPTGELHLGGAATFLVAWLEARSAGGSLVLRIEDLDAARTRPGSAEALIDDLRWLNLDWDEGPDRGGAFGPFTQSERSAHYEAALAGLAEQGLVYYCDCSRAEIARASSAPHGPDDEGPRYPGTCRPFGLAPRSFRRPPALRFAVPEGARARFHELGIGDRDERVDETTGDFVLRRGDGAFAYQLAVVVDDRAMGVTRVVRGADLAGSTARQVLLWSLLGGEREPPLYLHTPLVLGPSGERLAKRHRGVPVRDQREAGRSPPTIWGHLAHALGLVDDTRPRTPPELLGLYDRQRLARRPVFAPAALLEGVERVEGVEGVRGG
ncbi:MAG: tRNA glutamyl-Q(34) synthetase GluQRS [Polyangiaceae bacterium]|nr:tRNA glutamyl-Q(34) synthetase GluQRS [Polyangiaceae bacterium]